MEALRFVYLAGFGLTAAACFASLRRLSRTTDPATRRGLGGLLVTTGLWAVTHVGRLLPVAPAVQEAFYLVGLVVGLATVGAWLYFCSAYTGHDYHRRPWIRRGALGLYLGAVAVKLTNPIHGLYFSTSTAAQPFDYVVIELMTMHWVVTGLSYALASVGFYLLYEMLSESSSDVRALGGLVATTALPVVFYVLSLEASGLITLHYEPLGVAVFAIGTLYVVDEQFVAVPQFWRNQLVDSLDEKIVLIDDEGRVRDYNRRAVEAFPGLADGEDQPLDAVVPRVAEALGEDDVLATRDREHDAGPRYLQVVSTPLTRTGAVVGRAVVCTDVTRVERQRRQLERQSEQLDDFADAITHELRNALAVARGHFDMVVADQPPADAGSAKTSVDAVRDAHRRIDRIVTDLARLAAREQTVESVEACSLGAAVEAASADVGADDVAVEVERGATVMASRPVLTELFTNVVQFAEFEGAERVTVETGQSEIVITVDCQRVPENRIAELFAYGEAVPSTETGTVFPTIRAIGSSHGWTVEVDPQYRDGIQLDIGDVKIGEHGVST